MLTIILVFLASFIIIGSVAYILYSYTEDVQGQEYEMFGTPSRTQTFVSEQQNCDVPTLLKPEVNGVDDDTDGDEDDDEVISMEDVLQMRNGKGETVHQKVLQKTSGMGFREGAPGPNQEANDRASKPENTLRADPKNGIVWKADSGIKPNPPSHLMGSTEAPTMGGILPGLDREGGSFSSV